MIDSHELDDFARRLTQAKADLKPYAGKVLDDAGQEFLDICVAQIERAGNIDTGKLEGSFHKGGGGNIYQLNLGSLTLTVGSSIEYAKWVNKGHRQQPGRFVPGVWEGKHFRYSPGANTGMILKANWVKGSFFFEKAKETFNRMFPELADAAFEQFWRRYF